MEFVAFAEECVQLGMQWAFGIPGGGTSLQLVDALISQGISFLTTGHETTAALIAGAVSRVSGRPTTAISIKGPGFMNLAPGLLANAYEGYPMVAMAEAYPCGDPSGRRHKWLPHAELVRPFVKKTEYLDRGAGQIDRLWDCARLEFPGPVHLDLAKGPASPVADVSLHAFPGQLLDVLTQVATAERPAVVVGSLGLRSPWRTRLAELEIPVFSTVAAKGIVPERSSPYAAGVYTGDGRGVAPECCVIPAADLIVAIGARSGELLNPAFANSRTIHVESSVMRDRALFPSDRRDSLHYLDDTEIDELLRSLRGRQWGADECVAAGRAMDEAVQRIAWSPARAYQAVDDLLPEAVHVLDTGNFTVVGEHVLRIENEQHVLGTPNGRYMGVGIGYALGAAIAADPDSRVVLWIGDGGVRQYLGELSLAAERRLRLLTMVMADGYFGSIRGRAIDNGWTVEPLRMQGRDVRKIADAMGMCTVAVSSEDQLMQAVARWRDTTGPLLVRCDFDPDEYARVAALLR